MLPLLALGACAPGPSPVSRGGTAPPPVADLRVALPYQVRYRGRSSDLEGEGSAVTASTLRAGGVRLMVMSLFVPSDLRGRREPSFAELESVLDAADEVCRASPLLRGPGEDDGAVRVLYAVEGSGAEPEQVAGLVRRGVALFGLVHAWHGPLCDSAIDPRPGRGGLTSAGERFVEAVYDAGALVDLSHASDEGFDDVARIARARGRPLVASHSNARALCGHRRNLDDTRLRAIAESGGVVGLTFHQPFLRRDGVRATARDVARHARHVIEVMGPGHVALGTDLDGLITPAEGLESHEGVPALVDALAEEGIEGASRRSLLFDGAARLLGQTSAWDL